MFGLGKPRTKFGKWMDREGLGQGRVASICKIGRNTVSRLANDPKHKVTTETSKKIIKELRLAGYDVEFGDLF